MTAEGTDGFTEAMARLHATTADLEQSVKQSSYLIQVGVDALGFLTECADRGALPDDLRLRLDAFFQRVRSDLERHQAHD